MSAKAAILDGIRRAHGRGPLAQPPQPLPAAAIPARARDSGPAAVARFCAMAEEASAQLVRLASLAELPGAVKAEIARLKLDPAVALAPDPALIELDWTGLAVRRGPARPDDMVGVVQAFAGVAETGSLVLLSGPQSPTSLNFLPDLHIVALFASQIVGGFEDAFAKIEREAGGMPRTVNLITGPSRTGDIEQTILMGAHGPRRLVVALIGDA
ncbi:MAG: LUD domain-containing protein [Rhodospirillales bacterium]|nr:LUD domain-containing protein [Rhodospirillales bacterium]